MLLTTFDGQVRPVTHVLTKTNTYMYKPGCKTTYSCIYQWFKKYQLRLFSYSCLSVGENADSEDHDQEENLEFVLIQREIIAVKSPSNHEWGIVLDSAQGMKCLTCKYTSHNCMHVKHVLKGRYILGDKLLQHVTATDHSVCTGRVTSCSYKVRRHVAATNRFVCTGEFLWKSLSPQQNFVAATSCKKSNQTESVWLDTCGDKFCCSNKDFHKNSPVHAKRFVAATCRRDMLLQLCRLVCTDLNSVENAACPDFVSDFYEYCTACASNQNAAKQSGPHCLSYQKIPFNNPGAVEGLLQIWSAHCLCSRWKWCLPCLCRRSLSSGQFSNMERCHPLYSV